jgi:hypothetical protein
VNDWLECLAACSYICIGGGLVAGLMRLAGVANPHLPGLILLAPLGVLGLVACSHLYRRHPK